MGAGAHVTERTEPLGWLELPAGAPTLSALSRLRRFRSLLLPLGLVRLLPGGCLLALPAIQVRAFVPLRAARSGRPGRARCPGTWSHTSRRGARCGRPSPCSGGRPPAMSVRRSCGVLPLRRVEARTRQAARPATRCLRPLSSRHHPVHQRPPFTQTLVHPSHRRIRDTTDGRCADLTEPARRSRAPRVGLEPACKRASAFAQDSTGTALPAHERPENFAIAHDPGLPSRSRRGARRRACTMSARGDNMLDVSSSQGDPEALRKAAEAVKVLEDRIVAIAQGAGAASALVRLTVGSGASSIVLL